MKVRIGVSLGPAAVPAGFASVVDQLETAGVDSLWLSEMVFGSLVEPFAGMAYALGRTQRLKVGTGVAVLPGRHPVLVAKELASLAALAPGRVLPVFGLQPARRGELDVFTVPAGQRGAVFDESLELLRRLLAEETVSFTGRFFRVQDASVGPRPARPLDIWLGGSAPGGLRRVGRYGDGWLGSFLTPAEAGRARKAIQDAADQAGRQIEADHFGISLAVGHDGIPPQLARAVTQRRPDVNPADIIAGSWADARAMIEAYVEAGLSKFVIRPAGEAQPGTAQPGTAQPGTDPSFAQFLDDFRAQLLPLQN